MKNFNYAFRYLLKSKGSNITRIVSLTLGLLVSLLVFSYITYNLSYDSFLPDKKRIYEVWVSFNMEGFKGDFGSQVAPMAPALADEIPQIESATRTTPILSRYFLYGEEEFAGRIIAADPYFFDVLDYGVVSGDPKEIFALTDALMVSESFARKVFKDRNPIGEALLMENKVFTVKGVFRDIPANSQIGAFDIMRGNSWEEYTSWHASDYHPTYFKIRKGADITEVEAAFHNVIKKHRTEEESGETKFYLVPITRAFLHNTDIPQTALVMGLLGLLTIFIACMNYVLISISMMADRGKTMAMLKCNGATKRDVSAISMWETLLIVVLSVILAVLLIFALRKPVESVTAVSIGSLFSIERIWAPGLIVIAAFCLAGIIPAQLFARVPVSSAFRGSLKGRRGWKKALLIIEIVCVTVIMVLLIVTNRQYSYMQKVNRGFDYTNVFVFKMNGRQPIWETYQRELENIPGVISAGYTSSIPNGWFNGTYVMDDSSNDVLFSSRFIDMSAGYLGTMGMKIIEGRDFTPAEAHDKVIINREYIRMRGWEGDVIGKQYITNWEPTTFTIIGVIEDYWVGQLGEILPMVMNVPGEYRDWPNYKSYTFVVKTESSDKSTIEMLKKGIAGFYPHDVPEVTPYTAIIEDSLQKEKTFRNTIAVISIIALFIALMGLIGYLNDEINRRRKEIAIRKVNGAQRSDVIKLIARDAAVITIPSVIAGAVGGWLLAVKWQQSFPHKAPLALIIFVGAALLVILIVYMVELIKTWKIANSNPVDMINRD